MYKLLNILQTFSTFGRKNGLYLSPTYTDNYFIRSLLGAQDRSKRAISPEKENNVNKLKINRANITMAQKIRLPKQNKSISRREKAQSLDI